MSQTTEERWLPVVGYEGLYEVSNQGRVRSLDRVVRDPRGRLRSLRGVILRASPSGIRGYLLVSLCRDGVCYKVTVHCLVAEAFIGPRPEGMQVCHYDDDPNNNVLTNLRYDTRAGNAQDMIRHGNHNHTRQTECIRGHELKWNGWQRYCPICRAAGKRQRRKEAKTNASWSGRQQLPA